MAANAPLLNYSRSYPYLATLLLFALLAFWPSYLALGPSGSNAYVHLHATTTILWMLMLIAQPMAVYHKRMDIHRAVGKASYILAPAVFISMLLLANHRINLAPPEFYPIQSYILYLQISLALVFALSYGLAIAYRHRTAWHARFMICTAITMIDPILARVSFWVAPETTINVQMVTFAITDLVLLTLIWLERNSKSGREVLPVMLVVFIIAQLPAVTGMTSSAAWQSFTSWFASLPLS